LFGEIIKESDLGEKISKRFCEFIHWYGTYEKTNIRNN
jgi:hypothetical protein